MDDAMELRENIGRLEGWRATASTAAKHHRTDLIARLRKVEGQVGGIRRMYEEGRYCIDVLDQLTAARRGLEATALLLLEDHINSCVAEAIDGGDGEAKAAELVEAIRRFARSV